MVGGRELVRLGIADGVARLTLDRPDRHSSLVAPDGGWTVILPNRIGVQRAREIRLLNRPVAAEEAATLGLVTEVVPADCLDARIAEWLVVLDGHVAAGVRAAG